MLQPQLSRLVGTTASTAAAPRLHVLTEEPVEVLDAMSPKIVAELRELGHQVAVVNWIGGHAHGSEFFRNESTVRAGGNGWAVGLE